MEWYANDSLQIIMAHLERAHIDLSKLEFWDSNPPMFKNNGYYFICGVVNLKGFYNTRAFDFCISKDGEYCDHGIVHEDQFVSRIMQYATLFFIKDSYYNQV